MGTQMVRGQESEAAKAFADACYEKKLDVVGITDHNLLSKEFIPYLQTAFTEIEREHGHKITLFPGFEFEAAGVGRGVHVLCLFEPESDLALLDTILTECGITYPRVNSEGQLQKSDKNLKDILKLVQNKHAGVVILPHAISNDGIFDKENISEWLQKDQYTNPELFAIEISRPVRLMSQGFQHLLRSGNDCLPEWRRIRPIATLMSSDNKKLADVDGNGKPTSNSIGYRYSWIKMSKPSIESLRQAFLDHESRIILPEDVSTDNHPDQLVRHAAIRSISIKNVAFLADQEVHFSPNMNCVIGGRGSGKSTLLEYLRIIFGKDKNAAFDTKTAERIDRIRDTLNTQGAELEVSWVSADGVEDRILWRSGELLVQDRELADPETFFNSLPLRFYSQQQLNSLTESKTEEGEVRQAQRLLELVDGFSKAELDDLAEREIRLKRQIQESFSNLRKVSALEEDCRRLKQEHQELDRQWKARSEIQEEASRHQSLKQEARYLENLFEGSRKSVSEIATLAGAFATSHRSFQVADSPHAEWFLKYDEKVKDAKASLAIAIRQAIDTYNEKIEALKSDDLDWGRIQEELDQADKKFREACEAKGLTTDDVGHLHEIDLARTRKLDEIGKSEEQKNRFKDEAGDPEALMRQLYELWCAQFKKRTEAAKRANEIAVLNEGGQRFIEVSAKYQQDQKSFYELWQDFAPSDKRTRLGRNWESCGKTLYDLFLADSVAESPWQILNDRLSMEQGSVGEEFGSHAEDLFRHIQENIERWEKLRCSRVQDTVDMKLYRADGSIAGSISEGSLSDGQRNTAALALLLGQEGGPLVIDQPEDELDSNFVFSELIPMLRKVKTKRQLIMATHNANLPVNGDAELVYAFEARGGKGEVLACGGLDHGPVTKAVLDIMEGTEEAFRRRREKYHF
jgi:ABC-type lipoprotein export system ATPase subunit